MVGLTAILKEAWNTSQQTGDKREKISALSLSKECYSMKMDFAYECYRSRFESADVVCYQKR
jgi:hypothetical protein